MSCFRKFTLWIVFFCFLSAAALAAENNSDDDKLVKRERLELMKYFSAPPGTAKFPSSVSSASLLNEAVEHFKKREYDLARRLLEAAIREDAQNAQAYALLGEIDYLGQKLASAKSNYEIAYALDPRPDLKKKIETILVEKKQEKQFATYDEEHFLIKYPSGHDAAEGYELRELLREAYAVISRDFACYFKDKITVLLYDQADFARLKEKPEWAQGFYDGKVRMPLSGSGFVDKELKALATHEVAHAFIAALSQGVAPAWINEGLAQVEEGHVRPVQQNIFEAAVRTDKLLPIELLMEQGRLDQIQDSLKVALIYQQGFHLTQYLVQRYGMFTVKKMLAAYGEGKSSDEVIRSILMISPRKLEEEWSSTFRVPAPGND